MISGSYYNWTLCKKYYGELSYFYPWKFAHNPARDRTKSCTCTQCRRSWAEERRRRGDENVALSTG